MNISMPIPKNYINTIINESCYTWGERVPDQSVDLILCDPVYNEPGQYAWLAQFAARVLKPHGSVFAQSGDIYFRQNDNALNHTDLHDRPTIIEIYTGGFLWLWKYKAHRACQRWIWREKGTPNPDRSVVPTAIFGRKDKSVFRWGDGDRFAEVMIERTTKPGGIVCDPFAGTGTVPAAAKKLGRSFIGCELDSERCAVANKRIRNVQCYAPTIVDWFQDLIDVEDTGVYTSFINE